MYRVLKMLLVVLITFAGTLLSAGSSSAAGLVRNGYCDDGEICFYYNSNQGGVISDMNYSLRNYGTGSACNHFLKPGGASANICLKNNSASVWNRTKSKLLVYYNSDLKGPSQQFNSGVKYNFSSTMKNQNASHQLIAPLTPPPIVAAPVFHAWEDGLGGIHHHAWVTFKASDLHNGAHVKSVWVRITRNNCWLYPDDDTGQVISVRALSANDTTTYKVETDLYDSPNFKCPMKSSWGVAEYFDVI